MRLYEFRVSKVKLALPPRVMRRKVARTQAPELLALVAMLQAAHNRAQALDPLQLVLRNIVDRKSTARHKSRAPTGLALYYSLSLGSSSLSRSSGHFLILMKLTQVSGPQLTPGRRLQASYQLRANLHLHRQLDQANLSHHLEPIDCSTLTKFGTALRKTGVLRA